MHELQAKRYQAIQAQHAKDQGWTASQGLGFGGQGAVSVWIRAENGRIKERVAIKDTYIREQKEWDEIFPAIELTDYKVHLMEPGVMKATQNQNKQPQKEFVQARTRLVNNPIIEMRGCHEFAAQRFFRMALEYAPFGDLEQLYERYQGEAYTVPESFIWCVFAHLADSALIMEQGDLRKPVANWRTIVHRDIKTANIFLGERSTTEYSVFPVPKLGDFGLSYLIDPKKEAYNDGSGTPWCLAPEQLEDSYVEMSSKTNVYGIGVTVLQLMTLDDGIGLIELKTRKPPKPDSECLYKYSTTLTNLVRRCLTWGPMRRIDVQTLRAEIDQATSGPGDLSHGLRNGSPAVVTAYASDPTALAVRADKYAVGLAWPLADSNSVDGEPMEE